MFPSLSSCPLSTLVTTSFTAQTNQELRINQPVKVVGPNVYNITSTVSGFSVSTDLSGPSYINPTINLIRGVTYRFNTNSPDNSVYITNTSGTAVTTGFRYSNYNDNRQTFIYPGYQTYQTVPNLVWPNIVQFPSTVDAYYWTVSAVNTWGGTFPGYILREGIDYWGYNTTPGFVTFNFTGKTTTTGQTAIVYFYTGAFDLATSLSAENYLVKVNGSVKTLNTHYIITNNTLRFLGSQPPNATVTVDYQGGMSGGFFFTPTATTPSTLYYRSRKPGGSLQGTISISNSGHVYPANSTIKLKQYDTVSVTVTSPSAYLGYQFYEYFLSASPLAKNFFAVVAKNNYNPIVKVQERLKRYYNYINYSPSYTLYDTAAQQILYKSVPGLGTGSGLGKINFTACHILLDVVNKQVNIYSVAGGLLRSALMPDFPIEYEKYTYILGSITKTDLLVLCADGILYIIDSDMTITSCQQFAPDTRSIAFLDSNLPINEDVPFLGSFSDNARRNLVKSLFPIVTSFAVYGTTVFLVGANSLAKVNLGSKVIFSVQNFPALGGLLNVSPFIWWGVIATSLFHRIYFISASGVPTDITPPGGPFVLGVHCTMPYNKGGRVCIPDAHNHRLIVYNDTIASSVSYINLGDFVPAYAKRFGDIVYVTAHDNNEVIKIEITNLSASVVTETLNTKITRYSMPYRTTVVSVVHDSLMAYHYLNNRFILDFSGTGIKKVIPPTFEYREGPPSSIGTAPEQVYLLGEPTVTPIPGPFMQWWVNGEIKANLRDGELLGVNYRASSAGTHSSVIILGEHAIDYKTKTFPDSSYIDHYNAFVYGVNLMPPGSIYVAPVSAPGDYVLPFNINYFGTTYNQFTFHASAGLTSGILTFNPGFPVASIVPSFATATTDALLVEPRRIYIDYPIDNRIVAAVTWGTIAGGKTPGAYYTQGIIGEFQYFKWKYIATNELPLPNGFVLSTENLTQTGTVINMLATTGVAVGDYVSNPIAGTPPYAAIVSTGPVVGNPSLQVTAITPYAATAVAYLSDGPVLYLTTPTAVPYKLYSKVTNSAGALLGYSAAINYDTVYAGNLVVATDTSKATIIVEGLTDLGLIDKNKFIFEITTNLTSTTYSRGIAPPYFTTVVAGPTTSSSVTEKVTAKSITHQNFTFSPISTKVASPLIQVSKTIYDSLVVGQNIFCAKFVPNPEIIVAKNTVVKTFKIEIRPKVAFEGSAFSPPTTIVIDLITTNVPDGTYLQFQIEPGNLIRKVTVNPPNSDFQGGWEIESPVNTLQYTVPTPTTAPITFQIYNNAARVKIKPLFDAIPAEGTESYKIRFYGIDSGNPAAFVSLPYNYNTDDTTLNNPGVGTSTIGSIAVPAISITEYYLELGTAYSTDPSDIIGVETTKIVFDSLPASVKVGTVTSPITYAAPPIDDPLDTITVDVYTNSLFRYKLYNIELLSNSLIPLSGSLYPLTFSGNFLTFSFTQNLPANTPMLFKPFVVHQPVEFELAFYVGRNFQYIEYNYLPPPPHNNTLTFGLRDATGAYIRSVVGNPPVTYSRLFGSEASDGIFYDLNAGSFTHIPTGGFLPRYPRIFRERVLDKTTLRYDIYIDYKIPATVDVRASLDYGYLRVNDGLYDGTKKINENDIISVFIPFQNSQIVSAVILSIGSTQFALPATPEASLLTKTVNAVTLPGQNIITNLNSSFNIVATGRYMIPDYFRSATGNGAEYEFERWLFGTIFVGTLTRGDYHDLTAGDLIVVKNVFTGYRNYNTIEIVFAGVTIENLKVKTVGEPTNLVNYLNYGVLNEPFKLLRRTANIFVPTLLTFTFDPSDKQQLNQLVPGGFTETFDGATIPEYEAPGLPLVSTAPVGTPVELFASGGNVSFIVNSVRTGANVVPVVVGDVIGLEWELNNYHEDDITIWQITQDPTDLSYVYTEVGKWQVDHRELEPLLINLERGSGRSVREVTVIDSGAGYNRNDIDIVFSDPPPGGQRAEGFAILTDPVPLGTGEILQIVITFAGSGYVSAPTVTVVGPNSSPAILQSFLVENILARETELRIPFLPSLAQKETFLVNQLVANKVKQADNIYQTLVSKVTGLPTFFAQATYPLKPKLEFTYITTPQPLYSKSIAQSFITKDFTYSKGFPPTLLTTLTTESKLVAYNHFIGTLTYAPVVKYSYLFDILRNQEKVAPAQTAPTAPLPNYAVNKPANEFYSSYVERLFKINPIPVAGSSGKKDLSLTTFLGSQTSSLAYPAKILTLSGSIPLIGGAANQLLKSLLNFSNMIQITQVEYEASDALLFPQILLEGFKLYEEFCKITSLLGICSTPEVFYTNIMTPSGSDPQYFTVAELPGNQLIPDITYINYSFGKNEFDTTIVTLFTETMPDPDAKSYTVLELAMPDESLNIPTLLDPMPLTGEFTKGVKVLEKTLTSEYYSFQNFGLTVSGKYNLITILEKQLTGSMITIESDTITLDSFYYAPEFAELPIQPEWIYQDKLFVNLDPEWVYQDKLFVNLDPEWLFQDKLFVDLDPEWLFQDKLFVDLDPEWLFQDKLFVDLDPERLESGNRYVTFDAKLLDSGDKLIDFDAYLNQPLVDLRKLESEFLESVDRYVEFNPKLGDPGNRYIDFSPYTPEQSIQDIQFPPQLNPQDSPGWALSPHLQIFDKAFIDIQPELLYQDKIFFEWKPKLFQLDVKYLKDASVYGAFKTEFLIYADDGRAGDLGQYKGSPPGTPGRPIGPFIAYREFMGSALVMKTPTYGLGGFTTQAAAQVIADKYVDARPIKAVLSDVWNYRIYFDKKIFYPRKSRIFPRIWYIRGG